MTKDVAKRSAEKGRDRLSVLAKIEKLKYLASEHFTALNRAYLSKEWTYLYAKWPMTTVKTSHGIVFPHF